jgi:hypothetical protein
MQSFGLRLGIMSGREPSLPGKRGAQEFETLDPVFTGMTQSAKQTRSLFLSCFLLIERE